MDIDYHKQKSRDHYQKYKDQYAARAKSVRARNYAIMAEARMCGCSRCDEKDIACLDFHHVGGKDKQVSGLVNCSEHRLRAEIEKCIVLCANCHRKVHAGVITL